MWRNKVHIRCMFKKCTNISIFFDLLFFIFYGLKSLSIKDSKEMYMRYYPIRKITFFSCCYHIYFQPRVLNISIIYGIINRNSTEKHFYKKDKNK